MKRSELQIDNTPALRWGEAADKIYLFVHGKGGNKEEAARFAAIACAKGWQVLSIDLPGHGESGYAMDEFVPWHVTPELQTVMAYLKPQWQRIGLWANSIGAWFSMLAYADITFEKCLFVSPILDMERLVENMMQWAGVTEERLQKEQEIKTGFGETLSWQYLLYTREHPIIKWNSPTEILYAGQDNLTERPVAEAFRARFHAGLTVMEDGEHWFHTPAQLAVLDRWAQTHAE